MAPVKLIEPEVVVEELSQEIVTKGGECIYPDYYAGHDERILNSSYSDKSPQFLWGKIKGGEK